VKKIILYIIIFLALAFISLRTIDQSLYTNFAIQQIERIALKRNIALNIEKFEIEGLRLKLNNINIKKALPALVVLDLTIDELRIMPNFYKLLIGSIDIIIAGQAYEGTFQLPFNSNLITSKSNFNLAIENLNLSKIEQFKLFDIESGILNLSIRNAELNKNIPINAEVLMSITNFNKPNSNTLSPQLTKLPLELKIPALTNLSLALAGSLSNQETFLINNFKTNSNLGDVEAKGNLIFNRSWQITKNNITGKGLLSNVGQSEIGSILTILSSGKVSSQTKEFTFDVTYPPTSIKFK
jgi:hypothetical protein